MDADYKKVVSSAYDSIADEYLRRVTVARSTLELKSQIDRHIGVLRSEISEGGKVLDLGCGAGLPFTALLAQQFDVTGVDFSARQIELASAHFVQADMSEVEFPAASFDAATAFFSIIHVHRDLHERLYKNIADWLKPGGMFVASLGKRDREED